MTQNTIILASTSSIRQKLLKNSGIEFIARPAAVDEEQLKATLSDLTPHALSLKLAQAKALSLASPAVLVIGADQTLECDGTLYSKPQNMDAAHQQLLSLRRKTHVLNSAVCVAEHHTIIWSHVSEAKLTMRDFSDEFLVSYLKQAGEDVLSSVGGYKLEERGIQLFEQIEGDYFTILGLPLLPLLAFLRRQAMLHQ